ncbi:hypothetical protein BDP27DRAFT_1297995 [Rhodocollybia butyracea]|uniref:Uncharacterized protein n=1 Tax=Rhodocollybia butyracea TaxID=206335 RepID=A0A9P5PI39_9AGAR|nr:hypothetical protein BDP27DRAFT_1297995 [Rhodocollybia butyracea]
MFIAVTVFFYFIPEGFALPTPAFDPRSFSQVAPNTSSTRTVPEIIWSCLTTIFACTWVAVHPNIPSRHDSYRDLLWRRVKILAVALIAPEYIILWQQINLLFCPHVSTGSDWTLTHGMFLVMGGFVLTDDSGEVIGVLQASQLATLLKENSILLPSISSSEIMDRSKGDVVTKTLVLVQTTWFIAQVISRAFQHLPITELEITTLAFATINILTYILWWMKPLDVRHPILLSMRPGWVVSEAPKLSDSETGTLQGTPDIPSNNQQFQAPLQAVAGFSTERHINRVRRGLRLSLVAFVSPWWRKSNATSIYMSTQSLPNVTTRTSPTTKLGSVNFPTFEFTTRVPTFYGGPPRHFYGKDSLYPMSLEMFLGAIFGAIHCVAWTFQFPTNVERILWQTTSLCMTLIPLVFMSVILVIILPICKWTNLVSFIAYIVARLTTFVLAFTLLRDLPLAALQEVQWTTFIPHV